MNLPLPGGDRKIEISPAVLNHWATIVLYLALGFFVWAYNDIKAAIREKNDTIHDMQLALEAGKTARLEMAAQFNEHKADDDRQDQSLSEVIKRQVDVLTRLSAIESHDANTTQEFLSITRRIDDLGQTSSQRMDGLAVQIGENQRQVAQIEGKLGESIPNHGNR